MNISNLMEDESALVTTNHYGIIELRDNSNYIDYFLNISTVEKEVDRTPPSRPALPRRSKIRRLTIGVKL